MYLQTFLDVRRSSGTRQSGSKRCPEEKERSEKIDSKFGRKRVERKRKQLTQEDEILLQMFLIRNQETEKWNVKVGCTDKTNNFLFNERFPVNGFK